jgi:hypothetical protein
MTGDRPPVDPRFDPIFQRGYQGGEPDAAPSVSPPIPPAATPVDPVPSSTAETPPTPRPHTEGAAAVPSQPVVTVEYAGAEPDQPTRSPNPFIILLWIVGPALAVGGVIGAQEAFTQQWGNTVSSKDIGVMQGLLMAAEAAVTVGLGIIAGLLFWHAAGWRRARA